MYYVHITVYDCSHMLKPTIWWSQKLGELFHVGAEKLHKDFKIGPVTVGFLGVPFGKLIDWYWWNWLKLHRNVLYRIHIPQLSRFVWKRLGYGSVSCRDWPSMGLYECHIGAPHGTATMVGSREKADEALVFVPNLEAYYINYVDGGILSDPLEAYISGWNPWVQTCQRLACQSFESEPNSDWCGQCSADLGFRPNLLPGYWLISEGPVNHAEAHVVGTQIMAYTSSRHWLCWRCYPESWNN